MSLFSKFMQGREEKREAAKAAARADFWVWFQESTGFLETYTSDTPAVIGAVGERINAVNRDLAFEMGQADDGVYEFIVSADGIKTNVTLCFSAAQGLLAAKAGATYISPFVGRLDDISHDGMDLIRELVTIYANFGYDTQVLTASVRHPRHVVDAAICGSHVATIPFKTLQQLVKHPLTDSGLEKFLKDWESVPKG